MSDTRTRKAQAERDVALHADAINTSKSDRAEQRRRIKESGRDPSVKLLQTKDSR